MRRGHSSFLTGACSFQVPSTPCRPPHREGPGLETGDLNFLLQPGSRGLRLCGPQFPSPLSRVLTGLVTPGWAGGPQRGCRGKQGSSSCASLVLPAQRGVCGEARFQWNHTQASQAQRRPLQRVHPSRTMGAGPEGSEPAASADPFKCCILSLSLIRAKQGKAPPVSARSPAGSSWGRG